MTRHDRFKSGHRSSRRPAIAISLLCALVFGVGSVRAVTLTVTNTADSGAGSLRQAIADAHDGDTIQFAAALNGQAINLTTAELSIDTNITITGPGPTTLTVQRSTATGTPQFRIFHVLPGHAVLIAGLKISDGSLPETDAGGGIRNDQSTLTLNNCTVFNSRVGSSDSGGSGTGGGIYNDNGTLEINDSAIRFNFATALCGGIYNTAGGTLRIRNSVVSDNSVRVQFMNPPQFVGRVGGIFNAGTAEVTNCTVAQNTGGQSGGGISNGGSLTIANSAIHGNGVLFAGGGINNGGPLTISNSTITGNVASFKGFGDGGGIYTGSATAKLTISNSTVHSNSVASSMGRGGGIYIIGGTLELVNTILNRGGATGANIFYDSGTVISHGYNLSSDDASGLLTATGDQINTDPMLGPLQNNGGPTFTNALLPGSPALNAGDPNFVPPPFYDQRGPVFDRVYGGRIDIGSFELLGPVRIVTNTADSGPGSLRQTIADANNGDTIQFAAALNGQTIFLTTGELVLDKNLTISGPGSNPISVNGSGATRIFHILPAQTVLLAGLTIKQGHAEFGGGIFVDHATLTINSCSVVSNQAKKGAGIYNDGGDSTPLKVYNSSIKSNIAAENSGVGIGGGIYSIGASEIRTSWFELNGGGSAAGIANDGTMSITDSTLNDNIIIQGLTIDSSTSRASGAFCNTCGAGIFNNGLLTVSNSTISRHSGAIYNGAGATLEISNSTMSGNSGSNGGSIYNAGATLQIDNCILNVSGGSSNISNPAGTIISQGYNLCSDNCRGALTAAGDQINTNPLLGSLQNNGGPIPTHALMPSSPAVDAGNPNFAPPPDFDQRGIGFPRVLNGRINIGSIEMQPGGPTPTPTPRPCPPSSTLITILDEKFDNVTPPALPSGWTAINAIDPDGMLWQTSNTGLPSPPADSTPNAAWVNDPSVVSDKYLESPGISATESNFVQLTFRHNFNLQSGFDGGVLEIKNFSGQFVDILEAGGSFQTGGYNATIATGTGSPIAGRQAWSGNSSGFITTIVNLPPELLNAVLRWRMASDNSGSSEGWRVDTVNAVWCHFSGAPPSPTPTPPPPPTPTPTATATPSATPTPAISPTPTATATASATPTPSVTATPTSTPAQALNISTRLRVETGDRIAIGGFIITGTGLKKVAIRGLGPSLANFGISDVLDDPTLELRDNAGVLLAQNDNWQDNSFQAAQLTSFNLALPHPNESGIVAILQPGAYTALLSGKNQTTGIGLVEVYDVDADAASQLGNISTRGFVRTGDNVMIGGFILGNTGTNTNIVVRGIGPSLSQFGLNNVLADPTLELRDSNGALLVANDNWQDNSLSAPQLTARGLAPSRPEESGIFANLPPGAFTAILAGKNGGTGLGLVEVFNVQ
jgi:hypothetical protein